MKASFDILYDVVVLNKKISMNSQLINEVLRAAASNKVLLHFLRNICFKEEIRWVEERKLNRVIRVVKDIANTFKDLNYAFFKFVKPIAYVPSDIDLLVEHEAVSSAIFKLRKLGFNVEIIEPYCITVRSPEAIIDVYVHPTLGGMIYLDARRLLEHRRIVNFHDVEIPTLENYAEALVSIAHAIYKEKIYTLNDYVTVKKWFSMKTMRLAEELECWQVVFLALQIHEAVDKKRLILPYRIPLPLWIKALTSKIAHDKTTRSTVFNTLKALRDPRIGKHIISKLTRETY